MSRHHLSRFRLLRDTCICIIIAFTNVGLAEQRLFLIIAADEADNKIGKAARADANNVSDTFKHNVATDSLEVVRLPADRLSSEGILAAIHSLPSDGDDSILFYFSGHGAFGPDQRHYLFSTSQRDQIDRIAIREAISAKAPALGITITDACFNFRAIPPPKAQAAPAGPSPPTSPLFAALFFRTTGVIDINSAQRGQLAGTLPDPTKGSIFTSALVNALYKNKDVSEMTWDSFLDQVDQAAREQFRKNYADGVSVETADGGIVNQREQRVARLLVDVSQTQAAIRPQPYETTEDVVNIDPRSGLATTMRISQSFDPAANTGASSANIVAKDMAELVVASDGSIYFRYFDKSVQAIGWDRLNVDTETINAGVTSARFGMSVEPNNFGSGVRITAVDPNGPASRCFDRAGKKWKLDTGDFITAINGHSIDSVPAFAVAVRNSDSKMTFTLMDSSWQQQHGFETTLNDLNNAGIGRGRFGAFVENSGHAVRITDVVPGSPATRCVDANGRSWQLSPGDVVRRVNGTRVRNELQFRQAIRDSGAEMSLDVVSPDGSEYHFHAALDGN